MRSATDVAPVLRALAAHGTGPAREALAGHATLAEPDRAAVLAVLGDADGDGDGDGSTVDAIGRIGELLEERGAGAHAVADCYRIALEAALDDLAAARADQAEDLRTAVGELAELRPRAARLEAEVQRLRTEALVTRNDLLEAWAQIRKMRNTVSWRATTPFRILGRLGRYG